jgi:hypothetical protein
MKSMRLLVLMLLASCASTTPGDKVNTGSEDLYVSLKLDPGYSNNRIQMYQLSVKNNTSDWMEFEGALLDSDSEIAVLVGNRVPAWFEACDLERKVSEYNTNLLLGSLAVGGAVLASSTQHAPTGRIGAITALGSISAIGVREFQNSKERVDFQQAFPQTHIFRPFVVPPKKVVQRWILVENPKKNPFALKLANKEGQTFNLQIVSKTRPQPREQGRPRGAFGE